jgi:plasmid rolling circle replication initiator protein Rep
VFRKSFTGMFRALEVTYNKETGGYHPHLHCLVSVEKFYFKKTNKNYISHSRLIELWKNALGADYKPTVRISKVKNAKYKQVAEVAKYTVKSSDIASDEVLKILDGALAKRRLVAYIGLFKTVKAKLKLEDEDSEEYENFKSLMANPDIVLEIFKWNPGTRTYELTVEK